MSGENYFNGTILIIGASAAGVSAAAEIRKRSKAVHVTIITEENHYPYHRPSLTEYIGDEAVEKKPHFYLNKPEWYKDNGIEIIFGELVTAIDPAAKSVKTAKGRDIKFDRLIMAVGSKPFVPMQGALEKKNVFAIKTFDDAIAVNKISGTAKSAAIIGGGLLGLEAVNALLKKGVRSDIIELNDRILPMQLDAEGSAMYQSIISATGAVLHLSAATESLAGGELAEGVKMKTGEIIPAGMVIFSIGVRANIELASACGIKTGKGILVNEKMETSAEGVYACGDAAEFGRGVALWMPAVKQGAIAGINAVGGNAVYKADDYPAMLSAFGTKVYSVGDICRNKDIENYITIQYKNDALKIYKKLYFKEDKLVGGIMIGDIKKSTALSKGINAGISFAESWDLMK